MTKHNNFPPEAWSIFQESWECWVCGMNHIDCLHHIMGRGSGDSVAERSILNAAPMNNFQCHLPRHGLLRTKEQQKILLQKTLHYLEMNGYELRPVDVSFRQKYADFYK